MLGHGPDSRLSPATRKALLGAIDKASRRRPLAAAVIVFGASAATLAEVSVWAPVEVMTYDDLYSPEQRRTGLPIVQSLIHNERDAPLVIVGDARFDRHPALVSQMLQITL